MLTLTPPGQRLMLVQSIGTTGDGDSLAGQNVQALPAGVLAYVADTNRFYRLKKNLDPLVLPDSGIWQNVVAGVGSSSENGLWVAVQQTTSVTLVNGSTAAPIIGFDLSHAGDFLVGLVTPIGTTGFVHGAAATVASATFTSTQGADDGVYLAVYVESGV